MDDIVEAINRILANLPLPNEEGIPYKVYNIGNNKPENRMDFVQYLEEALKKEAKKEYYSMQLGGVYQTYAEVSELERNFEFKPNASLRDGLMKFVEWFKVYYMY